MKVSKYILMTLFVGSLAAFGPALRAADNDAKPAEDKPAPGARAAVRQRLQEISKSLDLTNEQKQKLRPIFREQAGKLRELRDEKDLSRQDRLAKLKELRQGLDAKVKPILTPEQLEKWNKLRSEGPGRRRQE
jgi:periplasmic protein CpxP/Spy